MKKAFVFPGQGSQFVGMGKELALASSVAREVFEEVDEVLKQNLSHIIFNGPMEDLTMTENTQPALMAVSLALIHVLEKEAKIKLAEHAAFVAGHSLGEYSALAAAGAFSVADTARLLKIRGQAMQEAVPAGEGAMAALLGCDFDVTKEITEKAAEKGVCQIANDNSPGQIVISGNAVAIDLAVNIATSEYGKKAVKLNVSAPFHSVLMKPAQKKMAEALSKTDIMVPVVPLIANVNAMTTSDPASIRELLALQVTSMVRWRESVMYMKEQAVDTLIEVGAGKVLAGLTKRIDRDLNAISVQTMADIEELVKVI